MNDKLTAKAFIQIQKSAGEVFKAIIDPEQMKHYFACCSAALVTGETVEWWFPEFPDRFAVKAGVIEPYSYISFDWSGGQADMLVEMRLEAQADGSTVLHVEEREMDFSPDGVAMALRQTGGWANFLACLKAYLEYGIELRKGAFEFLKPE